MKGHTDICRLFLSLGADVNQSTDSSDTALSLAIWQNHTSVCVLLIDEGADVDNVDKFGDTMLLDAAKHGNVAVMRRLLEKQHISVNHRSDSQQRPQPASPTGAALQTTTAQPQSTAAQTVRSNHRSLLISSVG